ncbi:MAG: hypothetical protein IKQ33_00150 [Clostridia bacterium]|nr:hypothetical protein [Clostridia bacterium]
MIYIREVTKQRIKFWLIIFLIAVVIAFAGFTVLKYQVEGEKKVPFQIGKIIVISSATTTEKDTVNEEAQQQAEGEAPQDGNTQSQQPVEPEENYVWNEKVVQTNDVYIYLDKNSDYKGEQAIKKVRIENIKILENVKIGKIQVYMPNSLNDGLYKYVNDYLVSTTLTYTGSNADNKKALQINNQGGCVCISFANMGLDNYRSNDEQELPQGGTILEKLNITNEDLKFKVSFDLVIEVQDKTYKTTVTLDMPIDGVINQKETYTTIENFEKTIYKRIQ